MRVLVELTPAEVRNAAHAGCERRIRAMSKRRAPRQDGIPDHKQAWWQSDIVGCLGEAGVCKAFGLDFVDLENDRGGFDVYRYQVRSTESPTTGLRVRSTDSLSDTFILAEVRRNFVLIHGYQTGWYVRQHGHREFENCSTLAREELYSITDLAEPIEWSTFVRPYEPAVMV